MRRIISTTATAALLAGAALALSGCGKSSSNTATADTGMTDLNTMDSSEGLTNDASALDATGGDANLTTGAMGANDLTAGNSAAPASSGQPGNAG